MSTHDSNSKGTKKGEKAKHFAPTSTHTLWFSNTLLFFGGKDGQDVHGDLYFLPLLHKETGWSKVSCTGNGPTPRVYPIIFTKGSHLYVVGGADKNGTALQDAYRLNLAHRERPWTPVNVDFVDSQSIPALGAYDVVKSGGGAAGGAQESVSVLLQGGQFAPGIVSRALLAIHLVDDAMIIRKVVDLPASCAIFNHSMVTVAKGQFLYLFGGSKPTDDASLTVNTSVLVVEVPEFDISSAAVNPEQQAEVREICSQLPDGFVKGYPFVYNRANHEAMWLGPTVYTLNLSAEDDAWVPLTVLLGGSSSGSDNAKKALKTLLPSLHEPLLLTHEDQAYVTGGKSYNTLHVVGINAHSNNDEQSSSGSEGGYLNLTVPIATHVHQMVLESAAQAAANNTSTTTAAGPSKQQQRPRHHPAPPPPQSAQTARSTHSSRPNTKNSASGFSRSSRTPREHHANSHDEKHHEEFPQSPSRLAEPRLLPALPGLGASKGKKKQEAFASSPPRAPMHLHAEEKIDKQAALSHCIIRNFHILHRKHQSETNLEVVRRLRKCASGTEHNCLCLAADLDLGCDDLFLVKEVIAGSSHITSLDISHQQLTPTQTRLLLDGVDGAPHVRALVDIGTVFAPEGAKDVLHRIVREHVQAHRDALDAEELRTERAQRRKERKQQRQEERRRQRDSAQRLAVESDDEIQRALLSQRLLRQLIGIGRSLCVTTLALEIKEDAERIEEDERQRVEREAKLAKVLQEETTAREGEEKQESKAWTDLQRKGRASMRAVSEIERERKKAARQQREELEREERGERNDYRSEEDKARGAIVVHFAKEKRVVDVIDAENEKIAAEKRREEREAEEARLREEERRLRRKMEREKREKEEQDEVLKEESSLREINLKEARVERKQVEADKKDGTLVILRKEAMEARRLEREERNAIPPKLHVKKCPESCTIVFNSQCPVPLFHSSLATSADSLVLAFDVDMPSYMTRSGKEAVKLEPGEITKDVWVKQKTAVYGGCIVFSPSTKFDNIWFEIKSEEIRVDGDAENGVASLVYTPKQKKGSKQQQQQQPSSTTSSGSPTAQEPAGSSFAAEGEAGQRQKEEEQDPSSAYADDSEQQPPPPETNEQVIAEYRVERSGPDDTEKKEVHTVNFHDAIEDVIVTKVLDAIIVNQDPTRVSTFISDVQNLSADVKLKLVHQNPSFAEEEVQVSDGALAQSSRADYGSSIVSYWHHIHPFKVRPEVLTLPMTARNQTYTEGDGDCLLWRNADVADVAGANVFAAATLTIKIEPYLDAADFFTLQRGISISVLKDSQTLCHNGTTEIGEITTLGAFVIQGRTTGLPKRVAHNTPTTVIKFNKNASVLNVASLIRGIIFRNDSENPADGERKFVVGLSYPSGLTSFAHIELEVLGEDDPTVIDFGFPSIPFRSPAPVPQQHEKHLATPKFYFASMCNVFDVDTTDFTGGYLSVKLAAAKPKDSLSLEPLENSPIQVDGDGKVIFNEKEIGTVTTAPTNVYFTFGDASIEALQHIFKAITFSTTETPPSGPPQLRTINIIFTCGEASPVTTSVNIKVSEALISILPKHAFWTFKEDAGLTPIGNFNVAQEDDGWDGGFIQVEYMQGRTEDDVVTIQTSNIVKLVDPNPSTSESPGSPGDKRKSMRLKGEDSMSGLQRQASTSQAPSRSLSELKALVRKKAQEKVKQIQVARQKAFNELRMRILEEVRSRRNEGITTTTERIVYVEGQRVGMATISPESLMVTFDVSPKLAEGDVSRPRVSYCQVKRKEVATLLRHICYKNVSDNPTELEKVLRVTASDGTPHTSMATVEIEIQPSDDATELRRLDNAPKRFRAHAPADLAGFTLWHDVTLVDPDTFAFNGGCLCVDLVGGGDPKGDQLGLLSPEQQLAKLQLDAERKGEEPPKVVEAVSVGEGNQLLMGARVVGTFALDTSGNNSNMHITFATLPEGVEPPKTVEEIEGREDVVTIMMVEQVLHCVTYTNVAPKVKSGARIYQAKVGLNGVDGKLKLTLEVAPPLLTNPVFGADLRYKENAPPVALFPKVQVNYNEKQVIKTGHVRVHMTNGEEFDKLEPNLSKSEFKLEKGGTQLFSGKDYIGSIENSCPDGESERIFTLTFDWASKCLARHVQSLLRCVSFSNTSEDPSTDERQFDATVLFPYEEEFSISTTVQVLAEDDPTEIRLTSTSAEVVRGGPPVMLSADAIVFDPDTTEFREPSYFQVELMGGQDSDQLFLCKMMPSEEPTNITDPDATTEGEGDKDKIIARANTFTTKKTVGFQVKLVDCTLEQLQGIVRRTECQCFPNSRDRVSKKQVAFTVKSGSAPVFRTQLELDVLPPLFELPQALVDSGVLWKGSALEVFPQTTVANAHFTAGGIIDVSLRQKDLGDNNGDSKRRQSGVGHRKHQLQIANNNKHGVTVKECHEQACDSLLVDGKKVGTYKSIGRTTLQIELQGKVNGTIAQKVIRAIQFDSVSTLLPGQMSAENEQLSLRLAAEDSTRKVKWEQILGLTLAAQK